MSLTFIACCAACGGKPIAAVPVEGDRWGEAEKWCYVAQVAHDIAEHGRQRPVHPARRGQLDLDLV